MAIKEYVLIIGIMRKYVKHVSTRVSNKELRTSNSSNFETQSRELQLRTGSPNSKDASCLQLMLQLVGALTGSPGSEKRGNDIDLTFLKQGSGAGASSGSGASSGAGADGSTGQLQLTWEDNTKKKTAEAGAGGQQEDAGAEDESAGSTGAGTADDILKEMCKAAGSPHGKKGGGTVTTGTKGAGAEASVKKRPAAKAADSAPVKKRPAAKAADDADAAYTAAYNEKYAIDAGLDHKRRVEHAQRAGQRAKREFLNGL